MRISAVLLALALSACAATAPAVTTRALAAADAATALTVGERIFLDRSAEPGGEGMDPVVNVTLRHADGRRLSFQEANHAPHDLVVQRAGGALAQVMGLTDVDAPTLYHGAEGERAGAPFFCGPQGPAAIGVYETAEGSMRVVGLRQNFEVETLPDGSANALPYSPDQVCARLSFRRG